MASHRQAPALPQEVSQVPPREVLHDDVRGAGLLDPDVEDPGDVLVLDRGGRARFAHEPLDGLGAVERLGQEELHRHPLAKREVLGGNHEAHAALSQDSLDAILASDDVPLRGNPGMIAQDHESTLALANHLVRIQASRGRFPRLALPARALPVYAAPDAAELCEGGSADWLPFKPLIRTHSSAGQKDYKELIYTRGCPREGFERLMK